MKSFSKLAMSILVRRLKTFRNCSKWGVLLRACRTCEDKK